MPYTITPSRGQGAYQLYQLGRDEELTVLAASWVFSANGHNDPYGRPIVDFRDASNGLIYRQTMNTIFNNFVGVSAASDGEPWYLSNGGKFGFPQDTEQQDNATMSIRLPRITLTPGCTFGVYICTFALSSNDDPLPYLDPYHDVDNLRLWVEDTEASRLRSAPPPTPVGPYMLVPGPLETGVAA